jgi:hypothetical protein
MTNDHAVPEEAESSVSSDRRIWKRRNGSQGSLRTSLTVYEVLYDAGEPLTLDEIAGRLLPRLDAYAVGYLEAWHLRNQRQQQESDKRTHPRKNVSGELPQNSSPETSPSLAVRAWLLRVFCRRIQGSTLQKDAQGRYAPGPTAPRALTIAGDLVPYTPDARRELAQVEHDQGRTHLALLEWTHVLKRLQVETPEARAQLLMVLIRRFYLGKKRVLDERLASPALDAVLRLADTPAVQRAVLEEAFRGLLKI